MTKLLIFLILAFCICVFTQVVALFVGEVMPVALLLLIAYWVWWYLNSLG